MILRRLCSNIHISSPVPLVCALWEQTRLNWLCPLEFLLRLRFASFSHFAPTAQAVSLTHRSSFLFSTKHQLVMPKIPGDNLRGVISSQPWRSYMQRTCQNPAEYAQVFWEALESLGSPVSTLNGLGIIYVYGYPNGRQGYRTATSHATALSLISHFVTTVMASQKTIVSTRKPSRLPSVRCCSPVAVVRSQPLSSISPFSHQFQLICLRRSC